VIKKFPIDAGMDNSTEELLLSAGLGELIRENLAKKLWSSPTHSLYVFPKTIPSDPYEALLTLLPNTDKHKTISCITELSAQQLSEILNKAREVLLRLEEVCRNDGYSPSKMFIFQHTGPKDIFPKTSYNTSYKPLHFHLLIESPAINDFGGFIPMEVNVHDIAYKHLFRDPISDFIKKTEPLSPIGLSSFLIARCDFNLPFSTSEASRFIYMHAQWEKKWEHISNLVSKTREDLHLPPKLIEKRAMLQNLKQAKIPHAESIMDLLEKFDNESTNEWLHTYKGINGTIGLSIDATSREANVIFSPKLLVNPYRHLDLVSGRYIVIKDKESDNMMSAEDCEDLLSIQRKLISLL